MAKIEEVEMDAHRAQLGADVRRLVDKYRAIFGWDVPDVDEALAQRLIVTALRQALDRIEHEARSARDA